MYLNSGIMVYKFKLRVREFHPQKFPSGIRRFRSVSVSGVCTVVVTIYMAKIMYHISSLTCPRHGQGAADTSTASHGQFKVTTM